MVPKANDAGHSPLRTWAGNDDNRSKVQRVFHHRRRPPRMVSPKYGGEHISTDSLLAHEPYSSVILRESSG